MIEVNGQRQVAIPLDAKIVSRFANWKRRDFCTKCHTYTNKLWIYKLMLANWFPIDFLLCDTCNRDFSKVLMVAK
jgi:hypothetical protein